MGKFKKSKSRKAAAAANKKDAADTPTRTDGQTSTAGVRGSWDEIQQENPIFEKYYKAQNILPAEEWPAFIAKLKIVLPTTFRFTGSKATAQDLNDHLISHYVPFLTDLTIDDVKQPPPSQLAWYPNGLGWQINVGKHIIRKSAEYKKLQQFLVYETEVGNLSRQEAVSMIPPLLLDVQPHHLVLDMCAAPGSKTAQLIEALHASSSDVATATPPTGIVVANDSDLKRAQLLVHQSSRLPSANMMVTNLDASRYPKMSLGPDGASQWGQKFLQFDRILCDVPCSGDGTMRKNAQIWNKWQVGDGNGLHNLQLRILLRAMELLKPGGRLVYSTCSFNPVENESVVAAALRENTAFKIVDASDLLPNLIRAPGLTTWKAAVGKECLIYDTYEEFAKAPETTVEVRERTHETMWPKGDEAELGLEKCLRLYPQQQDTGGFFVTVLEKAVAENDAPADDGKDAVLSPEPVAEAVVDSIASTEPGSPGAPAGEPIESSSDATTSLTGSKRVGSPSLDASASKPAPKKARAEPPNPAGTKGQPNMHVIKPFGKPDGSFKEKPYIFMDGSAEEVSVAISHFGLNSNFHPDNLYVRNETGEAVRSVYYTSDLIKTIVKSNEYTRMRLISAGVKLFARQESPGDDVACKWRACAEGLELLLPFLGEGKILEASMGDLKILLETHYPMIERFTEPTLSLFSALPIGSFVVKIAAGDLEDGASLKQPLLVPLWRARNSMSLMISKAEKSALCNRVWTHDFTMPALKVPQGVKYSKRDQVGEEEMGEAGVTPVVSAPGSQVGDGEEEEEQVAAGEL